MRTAKIQIKKLTKTYGLALTLIKKIEMAVV